MKKETQVLPSELLSFWTDDDALWIIVHNNDDVQLYPRDYGHFSKDLADSLLDLPASLITAVNRIRQTKRKEQTSFRLGIIDYRAILKLIHNKVVIRVEPEASMPYSDWSRYDELPVGIIGLDKDGKVEYANTYLLKALDYHNVEDIQGVSPLSWIHQDDWDYAKSMFDDYRNSGQESFEYTFRRVTDDDNLKWYKVIFKYCSPDYKSESDIVGFVVPLEHERTVEERLMRSEERLRSLFYHAQGGLVISSTDLRVISANGAFYKMLGIENEAAIHGKYLPDYTYEEDRQRELALYKDLVANRRSHYRIEKRFLHVDGHFLWCDVIVSAIWGKCPEPINYISIIQNIDEFKENEEQMMAVNQAKDRFFSVLGHDLKNPINAIMGLSEIAKESTSRGEIDQTKEMLDLIQVSAEKLNELLVNVIDWSRSEQGVMPFSPDKIDLEEFGADIRETLESNLRQKELELIYEFNGIERVMGDPHMLKSILLNLITNALKFSKRGEKVRFVTEVVDEKVRFSVIDRGIGLSKDRIKAILAEGENKFSFVGTENEKGTGLGLLLVKGFLKRHNATLQIESTVGSGATFFFDLD